MLISELMRNLQYVKNSYGDLQIKLVMSDDVGRQDQKIIESDNLVLEKNETIKLPKQIITMNNGIQKIMQTIKVPFMNNITRTPNILGVSIDHTERTELKNEIKQNSDLLLASQNDFAKVEIDLRQRDNYKQ